MYLCLTRSNDWMQEKSHMSHLNFFWPEELFKNMAFMITSLERLLNFLTIPFKEVLDNWCNFKTRDNLRNIWPWSFAWIKGTDEPTEKIYILQWEHLKIQRWFLPVWIKECLLKSSFRMNDLSHLSHLNGFSPVWRNSCLVNSDGVLKDLPQSSWVHLYGLSSWWTLLCILINK